MSAIGGRLLRDLCERPAWAELDGPSKTIVVEPIEAPTPAPIPLPEPTPNPVREPEKVPA